VSGVTEPLVESLRIAGERTGAQTGGNRAIPVTNPFTGALVGLVPKATLAQVRQAYATAHAYRPSLSRFERASILNRAAQAVRERTDEIAPLITAEAGLCLKDSRYEAGRVADVLMFGAQEARDARRRSPATSPPKAAGAAHQRDPLLGASARSPRSIIRESVAHKIVPAIASNN
jgi:acyl-CoA reductase-like NAD-dependent aldehyde dehydrogenase